MLKPGLPEFHSWIIEHQKKVHTPPYSPDKWNAIVTTGSQDALSKTFETFVDENDPVLLENPCYSGALAALRPYGPEILTVETDHKGIIPENLENVLKEREKSKKKMPKFLYTVPHFSNPSGASLPTQRKEKIYN